MQDASIPSDMLSLVQPAVGVLMMVKCHAAEHSCEIQDFIEANGYTILTQLSLDQARMKIIAPDIYKEHLGNPYYGRLIDSMTSGPVTAFWVTPRRISYSSATPIHQEAIIDGLRSFLGMTNPGLAYLFQPWSIRGHFSDDSSALPFNFLHCSDSPEANKRETRIIMSVN